MKISVLHKLVAFCIALVIVRIIKTEHYSFLFLFWNLFLAYLPVLFIKFIKPKTHKYLSFVLLGFSILFLPNAPYILTDLFHLKKALVAPLWFDLILIISFAILGVIYFIMAFELILETIKRTYNQKINLVAKPFLFLACGYGIYLGRYLRYNSWDIISNPLDLVNGMVNSVFNPNYYKETLSVTITFTVFLYLIFEIYLSFKNKLLQSKNELL
jgi:uncharacterized membrane protein